MTLANELQPFSYGELDEATANNLKRHASAINSIQSKAVFDIGEELQAAHDELANNRNGRFFAWCESIGIKRETAKNILNYHSFISQQLANKDMLEGLPKRLIYEAARPSTPQELKDGVAHGDITTLAEFRDLKAQLLAAQDAAARSDAARGAAVEAAEEAQGKAENLAQLLAAEQKDGAEARRQCEQLTRMATSLRATIERQAQELAERPERETVVYPDDYETLKHNNAVLERQLAEATAHSQGMSVQELAESDERFAQLMKSHDEEYQAAEEVEKLLHQLRLLPQDAAELREMVRCYINRAAYRDDTVRRAQGTLEEAQEQLAVLAEAFGAGGKLQLVK